MPYQRTSRLPQTVMFMLALAAMLTWAAGADAGSVTADYTGASPSLVIEYTLQNMPGMTPPLTHQLTVAGELNWTPVSGLSSPFVSFCIELSQQISSKPGANQVTYNVVTLDNGSQPGIGTGGPGINGPLGTTKANQIRQLWGMFFADVNSNVTAAAFQIAIWEIIYGQWFTPFAHNIPGDPQMAIDGAAAIALAGTWVSDVQTSDPAVYQNNLVALTNPDVQDQVMMLAPAPGGLALAGIGLLTLLGYRRRIDH